MLISTGAGNYPHEYKNYKEFVFANCPVGSGLLYEYPVLRNENNPWVPGKNTKLNSKTHPDRVVFQNSADGVYCGMITHSSAPKGDFIPCI